MNIEKIKNIENKYNNQDNEINIKLIHLYAEKSALDKMCNHIKNFKDINFNLSTINNKILYLNFLINEYQDALQRIKIDKQHEIDYINQPFNKKFF